MAIKTQRYIRKPLYVDAVRITAANFEEIAAWCQGDIQQEEVPGKSTTKKFIRVRVQNPKNPRQTKAFVGDWILYTETGYKVYTVKAFHAAFDKVEDLPVERIAESTETPLPKYPEPELVEATPESIAEVVNQNHAAREKQERKVLTQDDVSELSPDEIKAMLQSGDYVLAQDTQS